MNTIERILELKNKVVKSENLLEKELNIAQGSFKHWRNGRSNASADAIIKIAQYFNVSTDYLLCLTDNPKPYDQSPQKKEDWQILFESLSPEQQAEVKGYMKGLLKKSGKPVEII